MNSMLHRDLYGRPHGVQPMDEEGHRWQLYVGQSPDAEEQIRVAVTRKGSAFFAETGEEKKRSVPTFVPWGVFDRRRETVNEVNVVTKAEVR